MPLADTVNEVKTSDALILPVAVMPLPIVTAAMSPSVSTPVALIAPVSSPVTVTVPIPPSFDVTLPSKSPATETVPMLVSEMIAPVRSPAWALATSARTVMLPIDPTVEVMSPARSPVMLVAPLIDPTVTVEPAAVPLADTVKLVRVPSALIWDAAPMPVPTVTFPMFPSCPGSASAA